MTSADLYRRLTLRPKFWVMRMPLVTFTLGHARLLDRIELDEVNDAAGVLLAAKLCSMSYDKAELWIAKPFLALRIAWLGWTRRKLARDPEQVNKAVEVFGEYLDEATRVPQFHGANLEEGKPLGTPFAQHLRAVLLSKLNYSPETVDSTPYVQAMWDYIAFMESEGRITIPEDVDDDQEEALLEQARQLMAKIKKEERHD